MRKLAILGVAILLGAGEVAFGQATLPAFHSGSFSNVFLPTGWTANGLGTDYGSNYDSEGGNAAKFDGSGDWIQINFSGVPQSVSYWAMVNGAFATSTFKVQESVNGTAWTDVAVYESTNPVPTTATEFEHYLLAATRYVRFIYVNKVTGNIGFDGVTISGLSLPTITFAPAGDQSVAVSNLLSLAVTVMPPGSGIQSWNLMPTNYAGTTNLINGIFEMTPASNDLGSACTLTVIATNSLGAVTGSVDIIVTAYQPPMPWVVFSPTGTCRVMASETQKVGLLVRPEGGGIQGWTLTPSNYAGSASRSGTNFTFATAQTDGPTNYTLAIIATNANGTRTGTTTIAVTTYVQPPPAGSYTASFEDTNKTSYASKDIVLSNKVWNLTGTLIGTLATDKKIGLKAARLQYDPEDGPETLTIQEKVLSNGIGQVSLWYGPFSSSGTKAPTLALEISDNLEAGWVEVGEAVAGAVEVLTYAVFDVYVNEPVYFRIRGKSGNDGESANIDNISFTPYSTPTVSAYNAFLLQYNVTPGDPGTATNENLDGDAFTNQQEFDAAPKTNPYDDAIHP